MTDQKRILIAEITTAHGIKGFVKVRSYAQDKSILEQALQDEKGNVFHIKLKNALKGDWVAEVKGIADRNEAERLRGTKLYIDRAALPEEDDGEFYIEDLKGMKVIDETGKEIGTVLSIENFGASDLIDIKPSGGGNSFYLPFVDEYVLDVGEEVIIVKLPDVMA